MEEDEISNIDLPEWYKNFMSAYPPELAVEFFDLGWEKEYISKRQLLSEWPAVLELNLDLRSSDGTQWHNGGPWPEPYLAIGDDRCGNYWCIKLGAEDKTIYFYDHDTGDFEVEHDSIRGFILEILSQAAEFREKNLNKFINERLRLDALTARPL